MLCPETRVSARVSLGGASCHPGWPGSWSAQTGTEGPRTGLNWDDQAGPKLHKAATPRVFSSSFPLSAMQERVARHEFYRSKIDDDAWTVTCDMFPCTSKLVTKFTKDYAKGLKDTQVVRFVLETNSRFAHVDFAAMNFVHGLAMSDLRPERFEILTSSQGWSQLSSVASDMIVAFLKPRLVLREKTCTRMVFEADSPE